MIKGKAESLEEDKSYSIHCGRKLPTVIRLRYYVKVPFREVSLTRKNILSRDNNACQYCNYRGSDLSIDHVLPRSRGGTDNWENVTTACLRCNVQKVIVPREEANMPLKRKPYRPLSNLNFEATKQIDSGNIKNGVNTLLALQFRKNKILIYFIIKIFHHSLLFLGYARINHFI